MSVFIKQITSAADRTQSVASRGEVFRFSDTLSLEQKIPLLYPDPVNIGAKAVHVQTHLGLKSPIPASVIQDSFNIIATFEGKYDEDGNLLSGAKPDITDVADLAIQNTTLFLAMAAAASRALGFSEAPNANSGALAWSHVFSVSKQVAQLVRTKADPKKILEANAEVIRSSMEALKDYGSKPSADGVSDEDLRDPAFEALSGNFPAGASDGL